MHEVVLDEGGDEGECPNVWQKVKDRNSKELCKCRKTTPCKCSIKDNTDAVLRCWPYCSESGLKFTSIPSPLICTMSSLKLLRVFRRFLCKSQNDYNNQIIPFPLMGESVLGHGSSGLAIKNNGKRRNSTVAIQNSEKKLELSPQHTKYKCNRCLSTVMQL